MTLGWPTDSQAVIVGVCNDELCWHFDHGPGQVVGWVGLLKVPLLHLRAACGRLTDSPCSTAAIRWTFACKFRGIGRGLATVVDARMTRGGG